MKITSSAIVNGFIKDAHGKRGQEFKDKYGKVRQDFNMEYMPTNSIPICIEDAPRGTISYSIFIEDKDAIPVCGFSWIHWIAGNITKTNITENESIICRDFVQGVNSWYGPICGFDKKNATGYGGMTPPDRPHKYHITVYALDTKLDLENGFFANELFDAMDGHIIDQETITAVYSN